MNEELKALAEKIFKECKKDGEPISMEEAFEMAKMEIDAKGMTNAGKSVDDPNKPKKPRTVKISDEKKELFESILKNLTRCVPIEQEDIKVLKENKLIQVKIGEKIFKIDIIEQTIIQILFIDLLSQIKHIFYIS